MVALKRLIDEDVTLWLQQGTLSCAFILIRSGVN